MKSHREQITEAVQKFYPNMVSWEEVQDFEGFDVYEIIIDVKTDNTRYDNDFFQEFCLLRFNITPTQLELEEGSCHFFSVSTLAGQLCAIDEGYSRSLICGGQYNIQELVDGYKAQFFPTAIDRLKDHIVDKILHKIPSEVVANRISKTKQALVQALNNFKR